MQIHIVRTDKGRFLPDFIPDIGDEDNGCSQIGQEKELNAIARTHAGISNGPCTRPELRHEHEAIEKESDPRSNDARLRAECEFGKAVSLSLPARAEANVGQTNAAPGDDGGETGERQHPIEGFGLLGRACEEGQQAQNTGHTNRGNRSTFAIDIAEDLGCLILIGQGGEGARRAIDGGIPYGEHRNHDDHVEYGWQSRDASVDDGNDKGRGFRIVAGASIHQTRVIIRDQNAHNREGNNVEKGDSPEDLLNSRRERFPRVFCLCCRQSNQLSTGEGKSCSNEHRAQPFKSVIEGTRVVPELATNV